MGIKLKRGYAVAGTLLREVLCFPFRNRIAHLVLHIGDECNFRCRHCFVKPEEPAAQLSVADARLIAGALPDLIWLDIGGGEPFLHPQLPEIMQKFRFVEASIPTNGWHSEAILAALARIESTAGLERLLLVLSLDGLAATHDALRGQPGSFARAVATYHAVRARFPKLRVKINTVLTARNLPEIIPLMQLVRRELAPEFHSLIPLRGAPRDPACIPPALAELRALEPEIVRIQADYDYGRRGLLAGVQRRYQRLKRRLARRAAVRRQQYPPCLAGRAHAVIYANGDVAPCEILPPAGNLHATALPDILAGAAWRAAVARIRAAACHCTHDCNMIENILYHIPLYPYLLTDRDFPDPEENP